MSVCSGATVRLVPLQLRPQLLLLLLLLLSSLAVSSADNIVNNITVDSNGYILFCPRMGRFGNQMDYFLGTLSFAKALDRSLVLAPFIEYVRFEARSNQIPFDTYFRVDRVNEYHRAVTMEYFMEHLADRVWPAHKRFSFCYQKRQHYTTDAAAAAGDGGAGDGGAGGGGGGGGDACAATNGNPSGPFWRHYRITFSGSQLHAPLLYDVQRVPGLAEQWRAKYPSDKWPVLAFAGSPASYPVLAETAPLQRYFLWSRPVAAAGRQLRQKLAPGPYVAAHLRIGSDWERACELVAESSAGTGGGNLFSSGQCLGARAQLGRLTPQLCYPRAADVARQIAAAVRRTNATSVYIGTDDTHTLRAYLIQLTHLNVQIVTTDGATENTPHAEMALMTRANLFIGNCVSSFSAVVARLRRHYGLPTLYWNFEPSPATTVASGGGSDSITLPSIHNEL